MNPTIIFKLLALAMALGLASCAGTITSPYSGMSYDFTLKPHPPVELKPVQASGK